MTYVMESATEGDRLERKTSTTETEAHISLLGLSPGDRVLDAGAGTGAVARLMARDLEPGGLALAADRSLDRLVQGSELVDGTTTCFAAADLTDLPFANESFDLIWSRYVFEYGFDHDRAVAEFRRCTRRGGRVALVDIDGHGMFHDPIDDLVADGIERMHRVVEGLFDPLAGRRLYGRLWRAGFRDIEVHVLPHHLYAGTASPLDMDNWAEKLRAVRPLSADSFGSLAAFDEFSRAFLEMLARPDVFTYSVVIMAIGTRQPDEPPDEEGLP